MFIRYRFIDLFYPHIRFARYRFSSCFIFFYFSISPPPVLSPPCYVDVVTITTSTPCVTCDLVRSAHVEPESLSCYAGYESFVRLSKWLIDGKQHEFTFGA